MLDRHLLTARLLDTQTGFDAHDDDPLADVELQDEDYYWVTAEILASCGRVAAALGTPVRYLSVLEGGYDIPAIQRSAVCHVRAMLEGIPEADANTPGSAEGEDQETQGASCEDGAESRVSAEDGELAALREYLQECGINDA
jgi:acetoin utilization deacetylase AcuC-like enzyme